MTKPPTSEDGILREEKTEFELEHETPKEFVEAAEITVRQALGFKRNAILATDLYHRHPKRWDKIVNHTVGFTYALYRNRYEKDKMYPVEKITRFANRAVRHLVGTEQSEAQMLAEKMRKRQRKRDGQLDVLQLVPFTDEEAIGAMPDEDVLALAELITKLGRTDQEIILLRYGSGLSISEISNLLSITQEAVKQRLVKARRNLGKIYLA